MEIISLNNHIVRKALCLSLNEMAVLCDIKQMSQNPKYGYQCIKSKDKMAEWLDLSRATVFNAISALEAKGFVERTQIGIRPSQFIYDLDSCQEEIGLYVKNNEIELITKKVAQLLDGQSKIYTATVQNLDGDSLKFRLGQSKNYTQDTHRDTQENSIERNTAPQAKTEIDWMGLQAECEVWLDYKKSRKEKYKNNASIQAMVKNLHSLSGGNKDQAAAIIQQSMANNWAGVFELKTRATGAPSQKDHRNNPDPSLGAYRYKERGEFPSDADYIQNCNQYGHTINQSSLRGI